MTSLKEFTSFSLLYLGWNQVKSCKYSELFVQIVDVLFLQLRWFSVHPLINWLRALTHLTLANFQGHSRHPLFDTQTQTPGLFSRLHHKSSADVLLWGQNWLSDVCSRARIKIMLSAVREWVKQREKVWASRLLCGVLFKGEATRGAGGNGTAIRFPPTDDWLKDKIDILDSMCVYQGLSACFLFSVPRTYILVLSRSCS